MPDTPRRQADQDAAPSGATTVAGGERVELSELYRLYRVELIRFVLRTFGEGPPDPEDAAQAAFEHYAALAQPDLISNPRAFLYRSARNYVIDQKRRMKVRARFAKSADAEQIVGSTDELHAERVLDAKERLNILNAAIRNLEPRLRDALILSRIHEFSYVEVARRTRTSETQAKRLVALAVQACQRALREAGVKE